MKKIAIQNNNKLEPLKKELENLGYEVIYSQDMDSPADAYIYYNENNTQSLSSVNQHLNSILSTVGAESTSGYDGPQNYGTLLINAKDKTVEEIQQILSNRTYSPLF